MEVSDSAGPALVASGVSDPPAGDAESLAKAGNGYGALAHSRQRGDADVLVAVVKKVFVNLIGEDEEVALAGQRGDPFQLLAREHFS